LFILDPLKTIRNRESAQRSRNQRKVHLSYLEVRVAELEAENASLKTDTPLSDTASKTPLKFDLPLDSAANLPANCLSPLDNRVEDVPPQPFPDGTIATLLAENAGLKERVGILENLVKQAFALSNLSNPSTITTIDPSSTSFSYSTDQPIDWNALFAQPPPTATSISTNTAYEPYSGLETTLFPSFAPNPPIVLSLQDEPFNLARHPAAVATMPKHGMSLQRARTCLIPSEMSTVRLRMVAKVVVALARRRGWTKLSSRRSRLRMDRCGVSRWAGRIRGGMRR